MDWAGLRVPRLRRFAAGTAGPIAVIALGAALMAEPGLGAVAAMAALLTLVAMVVLASASGRKPGGGGLTVKLWGSVLGLGLAGYAIAGRAGVELAWFGWIIAVVGLVVWSHRPAVHVPDAQHARDTEHTRDLT